MSTNAHAYPLGRHETRGVWRVGTREKIVMGVGAFTSLLFLAFVHTIVGASIFVGGLIFTLVLTFVPVRRGKTLLHWLPLRIAYGRRRASGITEYRSGAREAGYHGDGTPVDVAPPPTVGALDWYETTSSAGLLGIVSHENGAYVTAGFRVEGPGLGLDDLRVKEVTAARWSAALDVIANSGGFATHAELISRTIPSDPDAHARYVNERGRRAPQSALNDSYDKLTGMVTAGAEDYGLFVIFRIGGSGFREAVKRAGGGPTGVGTIVRNEIELIRPELEAADMKVLHSLSVRQAAGLIRNINDPDHSLDTQCAPRDCWPRRDSSEPGPDVWEHDGWLTATGEMRWPPTPVGVNFLVPLLVQTPGVIRTVSILLRLLPSVEALAQARQALTQENAEAKFQEHLGKTVDVVTENQRDSVEARLGDLGASHAGVQAVGYVSVTSRATTLAEGTTWTAEEALASSKRAVYSRTASHLTEVVWCDYEQAAAAVVQYPFTKGIA